MSILTHRCCAIAFLIPTSLCALEPNAFFEKRVRPVLVKRCYRCHGPESKKRGDLRLDSRAALLKGGISGSALKPGKPQESLLIQALSHQKKLKMPPNKRLSSREISDLTAWVKMGAPWPDNGSKFTKAERNYWAFQPIQNPKLPRVKSTTWCQSPIDHFILSKLEKQGLKPAPRADRRTLIRRVTFDLIGLPPTPREVQSFIEDRSPNAFAKVIDRLLASPAYGEKWGRHWLDVARYADSNGMDENLAQANAYHYRDYVIRSWNRDKPYNEFVRDQIAGDLLSTEIVATGFLSLGPKMLAEDDPRKMELDIIDEQIDTTGRVFLGMTLGCARCHDHKFDPITLRDYYALAGIFKSTKTMDNFKVVAKWHERPLHTNQNAKILLAAQKQIDRLHQSERKRLIDEATKNRTDYLLAVQELKRQQSVLAKLKPLPPSAPGLIQIEAENYNRGNVKKDSTGYGAKIGVIYNKGELPNIAEYDVTSKKGGPHQLDLRYAAAGARPVKLILNGKVVHSQAAGKVTGSWYPDTQQWSVEGVFELRPGKNVIRLECAGPFPHFDKLALAPSPHRGLTPQTPEQFASRLNLNPVFLKQLMSNPKAPFQSTPALVSTYSAKVTAQLKSLNDRLMSLKKVPMGMAVDEGKVTDLREHLRGDYLTLGKVAPRGFPQILNPNPKPISKMESGRRELAQWLTNPKNPLTPRVMVNRLWLWHFGEGLVRSPDNFGRLGQRPTHPQLLDWLARRFLKSNWSIKSIHRLILLSSTYQMSSTFDEVSSRGDPENRLRWRWSRRRLNAEEVRDSLLAIGDSLDLQMGGSLLVGDNRKYVRGYPNTSYDKYAFPRRTVYLPVIRSDLNKVLQAFDFADPSTPKGRRETTTVAPQALFMMNSKLMERQSMELAKRLLKNPNQSDESRVNRLFRLAYGREATQGEMTRMIQFVDSIVNREQAWQSLCRVILASNEFLFVE